MAAGTYFHQDPVGSILLNTVSGEVDLASSGTSADVTLQEGTRISGDFTASPMHMRR